MITQQMILTQIEKLTAEARHVSEQQAREKFAAIHALCELVLAQQGQQQAPQPLQLRPAAPMLMPSSKLDEDDANGDSIFDF